MGCFRLVKATVPVSLLPSRLRRPNDDVTAGVDEQLNAMLLTYVPPFEGVVVTYRRVQIQGDKYGSINGLYPCVNFKVSADFVVFAPKPGSELVGVITKVGPDLINVLVHGMFTVVLEKGGVPEEYHYDAAHEAWLSNSGTPEVAAPAVEMKKGGLSKTARKKLAREQAKALAEAQAVAEEDPGAQPKMCAHVWLKFSILSLDLHGKIYQWKATARGEGLGVVPALSPLHTLEELAADVPEEADKRQGSDSSRKPGKKQRVA